ncbi:hypothetical protein ABZ927_07985 [Streptomyces massasporeus]
MHRHPDSGPPTSVSRGSVAVLPAASRVVTVGIAQLLAGVGVLVGSRAARLTGIVPASACLVGQLMFLSAFPWWSVATVALSVLVIFGPVAEPRRVPGMRV